MKKPIHSLLSLVALVLVLGVGVSLSAQQPGQTPQNPTQPSTQPRPDMPQQPSANPEPGQQPQAQPGQTPDSAGQPPDSKAQSAGAGGQTFVGTVTKSGDKYVLQDASGTTYNIDNQDAAKKFEGKKVKIQGTLDPDGKTIHVQ